MFYHMVQSFPKGAAVDPRQAHEAARRLQNTLTAARCWSAPM